MLYLERIHKHEYGPRVFYYNILHWKTTSANSDNESEATPKKQKGKRK